MKQIMGTADFLAMISPDAGIKIGREIQLGRENVQKTILANEDIFDRIAFHQPFAHVAMYGEDQTGHLVKIHLQDGMIKRILVTPGITARKIKLTVAYDGTEFYGFQFQKKERTIQGELEKAISEMNGNNTTCHGASRTDSGVHAFGQVVDFETDRDFTEKRWLSSLNKILPKDIMIRQAEFAPKLFHSRYDVWKKEYRYSLNIGDADPKFRHTEWPIGPLKDMEKLADNLKMLVGTHDFTSFATGEKEDMVRTIYETNLVIRDNKVEIDILGDGFLHHMVRLIVCQLVEIANGRSDTSIREIIMEKSRKHTVRMAPPNGLCLYNIEY
ncbi:MAG TPA: tRNA pseudouridine(38-40) synthase TruA [Bacillota bacterium]|nr:tRNA pseudouridine(38-40) synthase TruA [Bacillota bacterium]HPJ85902.1 tRNA pseudouridine(38-40) synthase TruA [Bacillota bacterium]